jgi:hypothetical protein
MPVHNLKWALKFGPGMSREMRRSLSPDIISKIRKEIARLDGPDKPAHVRVFVTRMRAHYPELGL